jgi:hypothetical protein
MAVSFKGAHFPRDIITYGRPLVYCLPPRVYVGHHTIAGDKERSPLLPRGQRLRVWNRTGAGDSGGGSARKGLESLPAHTAQVSVAWAHHQGDIRALSFREAQELKQR